MRILGFCLLIIAFAMCPASCVRRESAKPGVSPPVSAPPETGVYASRLTAAKAIGDNSARDDALSRLAVDAAVGGDGETAKLAVAAIQGMSTKDLAASRAALNLAKAGRGDDANAVALLISTTSIRDQTLAKIAKGEFGE